MSVMTLEQLYEQYIKPMTFTEQLRLIAIITQRLVNGTNKVESLGTSQQRSLLDLEGVGAEIWKGIDAQEYVNELRSEWDHRP